jgi:hypothetical protein
MDPSRLRVVIFEVLCKHRSLATAGWLYSANDFGPKSSENSGLPAPARDGPEHLAGSNPGPPATKISRVQNGSAFKPHLRLKLRVTVWRNTDNRTSFIRAA